ncbi:ParB/RepB/Spo0J family partition protein [Leptotrichia sp. oral taxon 212]|jgi:stage 0 sporulation protein J|uniref:ParB/RepB/Spo0J family partition protein n=1 Tax=Leptotrichia sp. oral taxon 212 TaxID=712357 RepID=UPI0006A95F98|nr:ParB/RepB/Spo0J family partition protein [Leptotrichia sp. oral taxon 212]ALA96387.1 stage 0 sporulation protein J [Leptotrichia sp. oral taxon 212]
MKLLNLKIDRIVTNSNQPRKYFDNEKMSELKDSIKSSGLIQPITVRKISNGKYEIVAGERRYRACRELGMENISAIEISVGDARGYELSVLENIQREDLNPIEEAESYLMLMEVYGYTQEKLSEKLGKTRSSLSNKMRILKLPGSVKEMVKKGEISYGHARTLLSLSDQKKIESAAKEIIDKGYSVRETEKRVKVLMNKEKFSDVLPDDKQDRKKEAGNNSLNSENFHETDKINITDNQETDFSEKKDSLHIESHEKKDSEKLFLEDKLREFFESSVEIKGNLHGNGKIEIKFHDYEELERIIGLMNIDFD